MSDEPTIEQRAARVIYDVCGPIGSTFVARALSAAGLLVHKDCDKFERTAAKNLVEALAETEALRERIRALCDEADAEYQAAWAEYSAVSVLDGDAVRAAFHKMSSALDRSKWASNFARAAIGEPS